MFDMDLSTKKQRLPVDIIIPFYKHEELVAPLFEALCALAFELHELQATLILINDSPGYLPLVKALERACLQCKQYSIAYHLMFNGDNLGFLHTTNRGLQQSMRAGHDVILLNSDTLPVQGALKEIQRIAYLNTQIGFVSPRSNNAVHCSFPNHEDYASLDFASAYKDFTELRWCLPEMTYVPTVVGFCMYIKLPVLHEIGLLDATYGHGYYEEYDYVFRGSHKGYQAVLANYAYVYHKGSASIISKTKETLLTKNKSIFENRFPEYRSQMDAYFFSDYYQAERMVSHLLADNQGKIRVVFDCTHSGFFPNTMIQTSKFILKTLAEKWHQHFTFFVKCSPSHWYWHKLYKIKHLHFTSSKSPEQFAIACKMMGKLFRDKEMESMASLAIYNVYLISANNSSHFLKKNDPNNLWHTIEIPHKKYHIKYEELIALFFKLLNSRELIIKDILERKQLVQTFNLNNLQTA